MLKQKRKSEDIINEIFNWIVESIKYDTLGDYYDGIEKILDEYFTEDKFIDERLKIIDTKIQELNQEKDHYSECKLESLIKTKIALLYQFGNEDKARKLMLEFIKNNPYEDEAYMCMQNWYMYNKPDIDKLAEVIDLAEENKHILITDFGYDRLVEFYDNIGDIKNKQKYQELYDKWKSKSDTIKF